MDFLQLLAIGIALGSVYALVALGFVLIVNAVNVVNFAQGEFVMLGAFLIVTAAGSWGLPYPLALALVVVVMGLFGVAFYRLAVYPLRGRGFMPVVISTAGMSLALTSLAQQIWGTQPLSAEPPLGYDIIRLGGVILQPQFIFIILVAAAALALQYVLFERLPIGRRLRAVAQDPQTASLMGIPVNRMIAMTFAWSAALGGLAGIIFAPLFFVTTTLGLNVTIKAFAAIVIGGWGSIVGSILGGLLIGLAESLLSGYVSSAYRDVFVFVLLIVILVVRPMGIMGERERVRL